MAEAVASIIKDEAVESQLVEEVNCFKEVHHIATVAMAIEDGEPAVWGRDEPTMQAETIAGFEIDLFKVEAKFGWRIKNLGIGFVEETRLHIIEKYARPM